MAALVAGCRSPVDQAAPGSAPSADDAGDAEAVDLAAIEIDGGPLDADGDAGVDGGETRPLMGAQGSSIARMGNTLILADEDQSLLRITSVPVAKPKMTHADGGAVLAQREVRLPGRPANVVVAGERILVTIRDPGMLVVLRPDESLGAIELARVDLPADAWGITLTPDDKMALVTSAWTHKLTAVDVGDAKTKWSIDLPREPRGIAIRPDGATAYVSHLTSSGISKIDGIDGAHPTARTVALPPSPLRNPSATPLDASLGYSVVLSPDGSRLYAPRHALGAAGDQAWFGASSLDVLMTAKDEPLSPPRATKSVSARLTDDESTFDRLTMRDGGAVAIGMLTPFVQPRFAVYLRTRDTVLVVGEGNATLSEHEAMALDPGLSLRARHDVDCDGASGLALSPDEGIAYVYCRASNELAVIGVSGAPGIATRKYRVGGDALPEPAATGRRIFYNGRDLGISGGLACAGCHPEGRDDGHVWREIETRHSNFTVPPGVEPRVFVGGPDVAGTPGAARQTPMLAGRVRSQGPFGWHAENPDLDSRIEEGLHLHRWNSGHGDPHTVATMATALAAFLRQGLVPPPRESRSKTDEEQRGQAIFTSKEAQCSFCHTPDNDYTDRAPHPLRPWNSRGFDQDDAPFRAPSLLFAGGTAPYYHDGSEPTLEALIAHDEDRMGKTKQLSSADKKALVAFLRTL